MSADRLKLLMEKIQARKQLSPDLNQAANEIQESKKDLSDMQYNEQQQDAIDTILSGKSCIITGAAGSGKTTTIRAAMQKLMLANKIGPLKESDHKWIQGGMLDVACVSFTNKAVQNLKKALPADMHSNCITIHKLLEYAPVFFEEFDPSTGNNKKTMRFEPSRHAMRPLPKLVILMIDESTMVSVDLWNTVAKAVSHIPQVVLVGDIHQLPPVFGKSIFIHAMQLGAKTVELTHIYRQALESPIIYLAHRIRSGKQIPAPEFPDFNKDTPAGKVFIRPWKKKLGEAAAIKVIQMLFPELIDSGQYNPLEDVILTPFNKAFGTVIMNTAIATHLAKIETDPEKKLVWEIYSGIKKCYFRIGDKVLHNKSEAFITKIERNFAYYGKLPRNPSITMDYSGIESNPEKRLEDAGRPKHGGMESVEDIDNMLHHFNSHTEEADKVSREASHKITVWNPDLDSEQVLTSSGEIGALDLGYAITVHKSQGSEYNRVFFITHHTQAIMWYRELLYTAVTRAAKELYVICESNFFVKGIVTQRIPGDTLEEKIISFNRTLELSKTGKDEIPLRCDLLV